MGSFVNNNNTRISPAPAAVVFFLSAFLPVVALATSPAQRADVLFLAYDQGESNAFIRIQEQLDQRNISYKIIAFGRAAEIFSRHKAMLPTSKLLNDQDIRNNRDKRLSDKAITQISNMIQASTVYSGMASRAQAQILNSFASKGSRLIAFYDNFDPVAEKEYVQPFLDEIHTVNEFHIPSNSTASSFKQLNQAKHSETIVTGQPTLENWDETFSTVNPALLRQQLSIPQNQPVILFAGGYNGDYPNSVRILLKAAKLMPDVLFLVTHHPKYDGSLEQTLMNEESTRNVRLLRNGAASTPELCTIASVVVVHKSTIAQQALYKHKPVIYVADDQFRNFILDKQLATRVYSPDKLKEELSAVLAGDHPGSASSLTSLGVPENASRRIADRLQKILNTSNQTQ